MAPETLKALFNRIAAHPVRPDTHRPAVEFEQVTGVTGIGCHYKPLPGVDHDRLEAYTIAMFRDFLPADTDMQSIEQVLPVLREIVRGLKNENPGLAAVTVGGNSIANHYHFILGVTSGFNTEDINYFIHQRIPAIRNGTMTDDPEVTHVQWRCRRIFNSATVVQWAVSPATARTIHAQMDRLYGPSDLSELPQGERERRLESLPHWKNGKYNYGLY